MGVTLVIRLDVRIGLDRIADVVLIAQQSLRDSILVGKTRQITDDVVAGIDDMLFPQLPHCHSYLDGCGAACTSHAGGRCSLRRCCHAQQEKRSHRDSA
ncbi:hypothetical protein D3C84_993410 [compost metagenome]